jgi:hypothetical protein
MSEWNTYPYVETKPPTPAWMDELEARERAQVFHALDYARNHAAAGIAGHGQLILIAKLARIADRGAAR